MAMRIRHFCSLRERERERREERERGRGRGEREGERESALVRARSGSFRKDYNDFHSKHLPIAYACSCGSS